MPDLDPNHSRILLIVAFILIGLGIITGAWSIILWLRKTGMPNWLRKFVNLRIDIYDRRNLRSLSENDTNPPTPPVGPTKSELKSYRSPPKQPSLRVDKGFQPSSNVVPESADLVPNGIKVAGIHTVDGVDLWLEVAFRNRSPRRLKLKGCGWDYNIDGRQHQTGKASSGFTSPVNPETSEKIRSGRVRIYKPSDTFSAMLSYALEFGGVDEETPEAVMKVDYEVSISNVPELLVGGRQVGKTFYVEGVNVQKESVEYLKPVQEG